MTPVGHKAVVHLTLTDDHPWAQAFVVIEAKHHSKALVILDHTGSAQVTANVEIITEDGADLTLVSVQRWDDDALHLADHTALVGRDASYRHIAVTLGGAIVRMNSNVRYAGPGGEAGRRPAAGSRGRRGRRGPESRHSYDVSQSPGRLLR